MRILSHNRKTVEPIGAAEDVSKTARTERSGGTVATEGIL